MEGRAEDAAGTSVGDAGLETIPGTFQNNGDEPEDGDVECGVADGGEAWLAADTACEDAQASDSVTNTVGMIPETGSTRGEANGLQDRDGVGGERSGIMAGGSGLISGGATGLGMGHLSTLESVVESPMSGEGTEDAAARSGCGDVKDSPPTPAGPGEGVEDAVVKGVGSKVLPQSGSPKSPASEIGEEEDGGKHNKYCHFCQHVKLRASAMMACENKGAARWLAYACVCLRELGV